MNFRLKSNVSLQWWPPIEDADGYKSGQTQVGCRWSMLDCRFSGSPGL